jgi:hypothetical protein
VRIPKLGELAYIGVQPDGELNAESTEPIAVSVRIAHAQRGSDVNSSVRLSHTKCF